MNVTVLIDAIVKETMILVAELATTAGIRAPLAQVTDRVFVELVNELEAKGVGRKVIADMFGLALRSYQLKVQRLQKSLTEDTHTLWENVHGFIPDDDLISRSEILDQFRYQDEALVRSILNDLVESGLILKTGRAAGTMYRAATAREIGRSAEHDPEGAALAITWIHVYRHGTVDRRRLRELISLADADVERALDKLTEEGRINRVGEGEATVYTSPNCLIPMGKGWEAAVFDHFQAMVTALALKLNKGQSHSLPQDVVGGSTYSFDVWQGHPHYDEVLGLLRRMRADVSALRTKVTDHNLAHPRPDQLTKASFYLGQHVSILDENPTEHEPCA